MSDTYADRIAAEQAQRQADREARRAQLAYNANAPADHAVTATGEPARTRQPRRRRSS